MDMLNFASTRVYAVLTVIGILNGTYEKIERHRRNQIFTYWCCAENVQRIFICSCMQLSVLGQMKNGTVAWNAFQCQHIRELHAFRNGPFWSTLYMCCYCV